MAVADLAAAAGLYRDVLGGEFLMGGDQSGQGFRWVQYRWREGGAKVELLTPLGEGFVARFLEQRGEGVHHLTYRVEDLAAQVERLRKGGVPLFDVSVEAEHWKEAFIHPRDAHGVLVQLAESAHADEDVAQHLRRSFPEAALLAEAASTGPPAGAAPDD
ncbi:MAG: VOC family protein [Actinobacteria bacterium]|nr:VOC family protein [Actinomycetota bacterium]